MRRFPQIVLWSIPIIFLAGCSLPAKATATATSEPAVLLQASTSAVPEPSAAPGEAGACDNEYMPVVKGANWTYEGNTITGDYTQQATILDVKDQVFSMGVRLTDIYYEEVWKCTDEGLVQYQTPGLYSALFTGQHGTIGLSTINNVGVTLPTSFAVGDQWDQTTQVQITAGPVGLATISHEFSAVRSEPVTVAGTVFPSVVVEVSSTVELSQVTLEFESTQWYVPGVGLVKLEGQMTQPEFDVSYELVGYLVP